MNHLKTSGISREVIRERGYHSILGKKQLADIGFVKAQQRPPGILIPLHAPDGSAAGHQYRPDNPRLNAKGKPIKYENPSGSSVRLDVPPRCREQLAKPQIAIWFVEGIKKADSLASCDACAVGLTGVWNFKGRNPLGGITSLADFDYIALAERDAYICYDSDYKDNLSVRKTADRLAQHLGRKGANVKLIFLPLGPRGEKLGVDDYLAQGHTVNDLIALASEQPPSLPPKKAHQIYTVERGEFAG